MRIVFIGSVLFSKSMLEVLISEKANIVAIITKEASSVNSDFYDLSMLAIKNDIPFKYVKDINHSNNIEWIHGFKPDILFCFGWSNLIKSDLLKIADKGVVGYHPSLLPANRGRHPIIWAKSLGLKKTGSTFFFMNEEADAGEILDQKIVYIDFDDDAKKLYDKIIQTASVQVKSFLPKLLSNNYSRIKQIGETNSWRKRDELDGFIDFRMTSVAICNLVRALAKPYVGAHFYYRNNKIKAWEVEMEEYRNPNIEPGKIIDVNFDTNVISVKSGDGMVLIAKHTFSSLPNVNEYLNK